MNIPTINTLDSLRRHVQYALAVEHFTVPPYLCALYSIPEDTNREATSVIQSVVMEEMLHMVLVANLLNAIGGKAKLNHPSFIPTYPNYLPHSARDFQVSLGKFSRSAIATFMRIERPEKTDAPPEGDYFHSIGQFYAAVRDGLKYLVDQEQKHGGERVFSGDSALQITREYYYGGAGVITVIKDLETAEHAIREIVDQGEGRPGEVFNDDNDKEVRGPGMRQPDQLEPTRQEPAGTHAGGYLEAQHHKNFSGEEEPAHYYRFQELFEERYYQAGDTPETGPRGPELPLLWDNVYNMRSNSKASDYAEGSQIRRKLDGFNHCYMRLLDGLQSAFCGKPAEIVRAVSLMYEVKERAVELMRIPSGDGDTTVGPSFEYVPPKRDPGGSQALS